MEDQLAKRELWAALSYVFVDTEIDFEYIADVVKNHSNDEIEFAMFERVAPVCIYNMLTPAPPVWGFFDEAQLSHEIELLIEQRSRQGCVRKELARMGGWFIRLACRGVWNDLKAEIQRARLN